MQTDFGLMLIRLCYAGPLLYIGLAMALDPAGFVAGLGNLEQGIRNFQQSLQSMRREPLAGETATPVVSRFTSVAFRTAGALLAAVSLLHLVGVIT